MRAAQLGLRTLVLTVDPAQRLMTALGLEKSSGSEKPVANLKSLSSETPSATGSAVMRGSLAAAVIDSKQIFDQFILEHTKGRELFSRIMKNRLYQQLSTTLSGSQEFTSLERLLQAFDSDKYDLVILDTPPTKHAMDFLTAPDRINSLFQDSVTRWFMASGDRAGFISHLMSRGTRVALKSLEVLTGQQFIEELIDFFDAIRSIHFVLRERSSRAHQLLLSEKTRFFVVTSFDAAKLKEAQFLHRELDRLGYHLQGVIINRAFPLGIPESLTQAPPGVDPKVYENILDLYKKFKEYYAFRYGLFQEFSDGLGANIATVRLPEYQTDVHGVEDLERMALMLGQGELK